MTEVAGERPTLSIVVLSWNTKGLLRACLNSLKALRDEQSLEVIVLDNASGDGSADMVAARFPWITLVRNERNDGYAIGTRERCVSGQVQSVRDNLAGHLRVSVHDQERSIADLRAQPPHESGQHLRVEVLLAELHGVHATLDRGHDRFDERVVAAHEGAVGDQHEARPRQGECGHQTGRATSPTGLEGCAISWRAMRPARYAVRPASTPSLNACAMPTGSVA